MHVSLLGISNLVSGEQSIVNGFACNFFMIYIKLARCWFIRVYLCVTIFAILIFHYFLISVEGRIVCLYYIKMNKEIN